MNIIQQMIAEKVAEVAIEKARDSKPAHMINKGIEHLADTLEEKERERIRTAASDFHDMNTLCIFQDSSDLHYKDTIFNRSYSWRTYKYTVYSSSDRMLFKAIIDRSKCEIIDLRTSEKKASYVKFSKNPLTSQRTYRLTENDVTQGIVVYKPTLFKQNKGYRFKYNDWRLIRTNTSRNSYRLISRSQGTLGFMNYIGNGVALGFYDGNQVHSVLMAAFLPLLEEKSTIDRLDDDG